MRTQLPDLRNTSTSTPFICSIYVLSHFRAFNSTSAMNFALAGNLTIGKFLFRQKSGKISITVTVTVGKTQLATSYVQNTIG